MGFDTPNTRPPPAQPADPVLSDPAAKELARQRRLKEQRRRGTDSLRIEPGVSPASEGTGLRIPY
jgi:hypothetical protein